MFVYSAYNCFENNAFGDSDRILVKELKVDVLMDECVSNLKLQAQEGSSACVQLGTCMIMMDSCTESAT